MRANELGSFLSLKAACLPLLLTHTDPGNVKVTQPVRKNRKASWVNWKTVSSIFFSPDLDAAKGTLASLGLCSPLPSEGQGETVAEGWMVSLHQQDQTFAS